VIEALEQKLRDAVALQRELVAEHLALAERCLRVGDELESLADQLYADGQDGLAAAVPGRGTA
jgi:hypothetical protein